MLKKFFNTIFKTQSRQAIVTDISWNNGGNGIDWDRMKNTHDAVVIRIGQGYYGYDDLLEEHVDGADSVGLQKLFYWQLDPRESMISQARKAVDGYGVSGNRIFGAIERTSGGIVTGAQGGEFMSEMCNYSGMDHGVYSRIELLVNVLGKPSWVKDYKLMIAQYLYHYWDGKQWQLYHKYNDFLDDHPWEAPPDFVRYNVTEWLSNLILWQFTNKLDARFYYSNTNGLKDGDGNVSYPTVEEFLSWANTSPAPPTLEERVAELENQVSILTSRLNETDEIVTQNVITLVDHEERIINLENGSPPPSPDFITVRINDKDPDGHNPQYFKVDDKSCQSDPKNKRGKPQFIPDNNLPKMMPGDEFVCYAKVGWSCHDNFNDPIVYGDGMNPHYRISEGPNKNRFIRAWLADII